MSSAKNHLDIFLFLGETELPRDRLAKSTLSVKKLQIKCELIVDLLLHKIPVLCSAEDFKEGGGVVGVRTPRYMASYWPTD